jgi:chemotaxis protein methyltransferase CheR
LERLRQLADRGEWEAAAECGRELEVQDRLNPAVHFYQALIFENLGRAGEPERSLRQAIYLDRNFALAHYYLGLALKRKGQIAAAARSFRNVLKSLAGLPDDATLTAGPEITAAELKDLAKMLLESPGKPGKRMT